LSREKAHRHTSDKEYPALTRFPTLTGREPCRVAPDRWFPDSGGNAIAELAKRACLTCPVLVACRRWGLHHEEFGIWGGMSPKERNTMRKARGITLQIPETRVAYTARRKAS
jgi:hypothetical protein